MNKIIFLYLIFSFGLLNAQCPNTPIVLENQADVNSFITNYPGCTQLNNNLRIQPTNPNFLTDLSPLNVITFIDGDLLIEGTGVTSLAGFENLTTIASDGELKIQENPNLQNIAALSSLSYTASGIINIGNNPNLSSISALSNLTSAAGLELTINNNPILSSLSGLEGIEILSWVNISGNGLVDLSGLENIQGQLEYLNVSYNPSLTSIGQLSGITSVGNLTIENPALSSLAGLDNITTIDNSLALGPNNITTNAGLENVTFGEFALINISEPSLTSFENLIEAFDSTGTRIFLFENNSLVNFNGIFSTTAENQTLYDIEIRDNPSIINLIGLEKIQTITGGINIQDNGNLINTSGLEDLNLGLPGTSPSITIKDNSSLTSLSGMIAQSVVQSGVLIWNNDALVTLEGLENLSKAGIGISYNESLEDLSALSNTIITNLSIIENPSITNLNAFSGNIQCAGLVGGITIRDNDALQSLNGLENAIAATNEQYSVVIQGNDALTDITALEFLNPDDFDYYVLKENPQLTECSILSICNLLADGQFLMIENNAVGCNSEQEVLDNCSSEFNTIQGSLRFDFDENGCTPDDFGANAILLEVTDGTNTITTSTDTNGFFRFFVTEGTYTTTVNTTSLPPDFSASPASIPSTFTGLGNLDNLDFCLTATTVYNDLRITFIPLEEARPGFDTQYLLTYENLGSTLLSGDITLVFDDARQEFLIAEPSENSININEISWSFTNLFPLQSRQIHVTFNSFQPPTNESGDVLDFIAAINPIVDDVSPEDNIFELNQVFVNSQDPNDKLVSKPEIFIDEVGDYLQYVVRFQNVGTAEAINVRIEDQLSTDLFIESFRVLESSHNYELQITNDNLLIVSYNNINLPAEVQDPEGSNGFIAFEIKTLNSLLVGDIIQNQAEIYFDFNAPIITNTVETVIVEPLGINDYSYDYFVKVFPNPTNKEIFIYTPDDVTFEGASIYNIIGTKIATFSTQEFDISQLQSGIYILEISLDNRRLTKKIIKN